MCPQHSRAPKASKRSPGKSSRPREEVIQRRVRGQRRRTGLRKAEEADNVADADEGTERDILSAIDDTYSEERVGEEDEKTAVEINDKGLDDSEDDRVSVCSSTASGPSLYVASSKKQKPSQNLCLACQKLYQKAKRIKTQIKSKLLDNNPNSLTCDQWVLIKKWTPRSLPSARGKLLSHVLQIENTCAKRNEQCGGGSSDCSRPHPFLQRNLRRCIKAKKERKKNRKKRPRDDSQGSRAAKKHCLRSSGLCMDDKLNSCPSQEKDDQWDTNVAVELIPSSVTLEIPKLSERTPKRRASKKMGRFRGLLAQLRGNSSMIFRETR